MFFAAPAWRLEILSGLIRRCGCGIGLDRGILTIYAGSIRDMHELAETIMRERRRLRTKPVRPRARRTPIPAAEQLSLLDSSVGSSEGARDL